MATEKHRVQLKRWKILIQDRMNSNLKVLDWCEQNQVSKDAYYYWLDQVRKEVTAETECSTPVLSESNSFVEICPATSPVVTSASGYTRPSAIIRRNGLEIELLEEASSTFIRQLLEAVRYA